VDLSVQQGSGARAQLPLERTARHLHRVAHPIRCMALSNMVPEQDLRQRQSGRAGNRKLRPGSNVQHPRRAHRHQDGGSRADVELLGWPVRLPVVRNIRRGAGGEPVPASVQRNQLARSRLHRRPLTLGSPESPCRTPAKRSGLAFGGQAHPVELCAARTGAARATNGATELSEFHRTRPGQDGSSKPERPHFTPPRRYRTQEVAGSSPASSTELGSA
jgi:hypothetical protein